MSGHYNIADLLKTTAGGALAGGALYEAGELLPGILGRANTSEAGAIGRKVGEELPAAQQFALDSSSARALTSADQEVARRLTAQLEGCDLVMCQSAATEFRSAVARLAGMRLNGAILRRWETIAYGSGSSSRLSRYAAAPE